MAARSMLARVPLILALVSGCAKSPEAPAPGPADAGRGQPSAQADAPGEDAEEPEAPEPEPEPEPEALKPPAPPPKKPELEMTFVGDVIFGRYRAAGYDPIPEGDHKVFHKTAEFLKSDALFGNLETPLAREIPDKSPIGSRYSFGATLEHAKHLVEAGFVAMSLANNHWSDLGRKGAESTPVLLEELGIVPLGAAAMEGEQFRVETVEVHGWKLGFVAITTRSNSPMREGRPVTPYLFARHIKTKISPLIAEAKDKHDLMIVQVHWGEEYEDGPSYVQVAAAHSMIDAGADLVIGHHPHVLQGTELYGDGLIAYSLGNFLFENTNDPARLTGVLRIRFQGSRDCMEEVRFHPAYVTRLPVQHPVPARGYMGRKVRDRMKLVNRRFKSVWELDETDLVLKIPDCPAG